MTYMNRYIDCLYAFLLILIVPGFDALPIYAAEEPDASRGSASRQLLHTAESLPGHKTVPRIFPLILDEAGNPQPERITFTGGGELGIFDPSIARDPGNDRLWMSYSAVDESQFYVTSIYWGVSIRLAYSDDNGSTWQDAGVAVSMFSEHTVGPLNVTNPAPPIDAGSNGIWQSETSTLIYDPAASEAERWKLLWFQYLHADGVSYFLDYSWLAMKAAATPTGLATATAVKLFAGFGLQTDGENTGSPAFSPIGGPPAINLNKDLTRAPAGVNLADLQYCVFAEPGLYATGSAVYLSVFCAEVFPIAAHYIELFQCPSPCDIESANSWVYLGRLLTPADAAAAVGRDHFQAPAIVEQDARTFLIVTPVDVTVGNRYDGCRVYEFADIDSAELARNGGGQLIEIQRVSGKTGTHHGACAAYDGLQGGIIYSQFDPADAPETFRIYKSQLSLP